MPTYITVLNSNANSNSWRAVQKSESLAAIKANPFYTAGINWSMPKSSGDSYIEDKTVTESLTGATGGAKIYRVAPQTSNALKLMSGNAPKSLLKKILSNKKITK